MNTVKYWRENRDGSVDLLMVKLSSNNRFFGKRLGIARADSHMAGRGFGRRKPLSICGRPPEQRPGYRQPSEQERRHRRQRDRDEDHRAAA